ncbi:hypothetical protein D3C87_1607880 [compost metagenome]
MDTERKISWETNIGVWTQEDLDRLQSEYVAKILPLFNGGEWAISSDVRQYKTSHIDMDKHVAWKHTNGAKLGVIIVESAVVKLQINKASAGSKGFTVQATVNEEEASDWLATQGF